MFDKDHYRNHPELRKQLHEELAKGATETPEELRKRARSLGNKKTCNAKGRRWWDNR
jgi:hypothetical protein